MHNNTFTPLLLLALSTILSTPIHASPLNIPASQLRAAEDALATDADATRIAAQIFTDSFLATQQQQPEHLSARQLSAPGSLGGTSSPVSPAGAAGAAGCTPNAFERFNLNHHHDINTGDIIVGNRVRKGAAKVPGGSGCSPVWAGGSYDDEAMFPGGVYPNWLAGAGAAVVPAPGMEGGGA